MEYVLFINMLYNSELYVMVFLVVICVGMGCNCLLYTSQQQNIFEGMNIRYFGPINGHDVKNIARVLRDIKDMQGPDVYKRQVSALSSAASHRK